MGTAFLNLDMSKTIIIILLSVVPSLLLLALILYSDRKSREPLLMILICAFSGAFTICLSLIIDKLILKSHLIVGDLFTDSNTYSIYRIMILAGVEEYVKLLVLYLFLYRNKAFDDIFDGFVYSSIIALSFSLIETILYIINETTFNDMSSLAILRNFTAIPLHVTCGIAMGYFVSLEKFAKDKRKKVINMFFALVIPTLIHTIYNVFFSIVSFQANSLSSIIVIILFILSVYFIGIMFILRTNALNKIFITNGLFPRKYDFLMKKNEFVYKERGNYYGA